MPNQLPISVIIPSYNRAHVLPRAVRSVLDQEVLPAELVIVDDGSTDDTLKVLQSIEKNPEVSVSILSSDNHGVSHARNLGIQNSIQPWIAFLDSDDWWKPDKLKLQWRKLEETGLRVCHTEEIWIRNGVRVNQGKRHKKGGGDQFIPSLKLCLISPSSILLNREVFERTGLFREDLMACEDYNLWLKITALEEVCFCNEELTYKTGGHQDQLSRKYPAMDRFRIESLLELIQNFDLSEERKNALLDVLFQKLKVYITGALKRDREQQIKVLLQECNESLKRAGWEDVSNDILSRIRLKPEFLNRCKKLLALR